MKSKKLVNLLMLCFTFALSSCDLFLSEPVVENPSTSEEHVHSYDEGEEVIKATCTNQGKMVYTCNICDEIKEEIIEPLGHTEVIDEAMMSTCFINGLTQGSHCIVCNEVILAQKELPLANHVEVIDAAVEATCNSYGLTQGSHCEMCNKVIVEQEPIARLKHEMIENKCVTCDYDASDYSNGLMFYLDRDTLGYTLYNSSK